MSRADARSRRLRRRPSRAVAAGIVAAVLTAIGVLAVIATLDALITGAWPAVVDTTAGRIARLGWGSVPVITAGAVLLVLGIVLLVAAVKPGGYRSATLQPPPGGAVPQTDYVLTTRAMARLAAARADTVDGVDHVSASATAGTVRVRVTTASEQTGEIRERVQREVADVLTAAGLQPAPRISTSVQVRGI